MPALHMTNSSEMGDSVLPLRRRSPLQGELAATLVFRVNNFEHLAAAYGVDTAHEVMNTVSHALAVVLESYGSVTLARDVVSVVIPDISALGQGTGQIACERLVCDYASALAKRSIIVGGQAVHASISAGWVSAIGSDRSPASTEKDADLYSILSHSELPGSPLHSRSVAIARYIRDMQLSAALFANLERDELQFAWQPVRSANPPGDILYHECLPQLIRDGEVTSAGEATDALERLGLVRALDQHAVNFVIGELLVDSTVCLAVNISAQSARLDEWWCRAVELLTQQRDLARRLVIEIGQTTPISDIERAVRFVQKMRSLGIRVALDGFGAGFASVRQSLALKPDIVKLDALFMRHALEPGSGRETFRHLAGLAENLAPLVIAAGVEAQCERQIASDAGIKWQQGHYHGAPANVRVGRLVRGSGTQPTSPGNAARRLLRIV